MLGNMNNSTKELLATIARTETEKMLGTSGPVYLVKLALYLQKGGDCYRAAKVLNDALHFMYPSTKAQDAIEVNTIDDNVHIYLPAKDTPETITNGV